MYSNIFAMIIVYSQLEIVHMEYTVAVGAYGVRKYETPELD